jgi:hypothetical protein
MSERAGPLHTPDGRYIVVRGRLWRASNPHLAPEQRQQLVDELSRARREVARLRRIGGDEASAHAAVDEVKHALGERGPVWWDDGAPDLSRHMACNTPYGEWYASTQS